MAEKIYTDLPVESIGNKLVVLEYENEDGVFDADFYDSASGAHLVGVEQADEDELFEFIEENSNTATAHKILKDFK